MFGLFFYYNAENKKIPQVIETCGTPTLLKAARYYDLDILAAQDEEAIGSFIE